MKLGMKLTFSLFLAGLVGLVCGGAWLRWASYRDAREDARVRGARLLRSVEGGLARSLARADREALRDLVELAHESLPVGSRIEVTDRAGTRLAGVGVPPAEGRTLDVIYKPLARPSGELVGAVQVILGRDGLGEEAAARSRAGGTALFVGLFLMWMLSEVLAAVVVLSPVKKLHRALQRAAARPAPADVALLREEVRTRGKDELDAIVENTLKVVERSATPGEGPRLRAVDDDPEDSGDAEIA